MCNVAYNGKWCCPSFFITWYCSSWFITRD